MKKFYTLIAGLCLMTSAQFASAQTLVKEKSNSQYETILDKLNLMPDQVKEMKKNDDNFRKQLSSTFDISNEAKLQKAIEKIQADYDKELENILTTHQYKTFHDLKEKARQGEGRMF